MQKDKGVLAYLRITLQLEQEFCFFQLFASLNDGSLVL